MKTKLSLILFAAVVVAAFFAVRAALARHAANEATAAIARRGAEIEQQIDRAKRRLRDIGEACSAVEKKIAETRLPENTAPLPPPRKLSPYTIIANDPVKMAAYTRDFHASLDLEYGGLQKAIGLSPELFEKIKNLKTAHEQRRMDILAAAEMQGMDLKSPAYRALQKEEAAQLAKREAELLGPLTEPYREFERTQPVRESARRLGSCETYPEPPLTSAEVERVVDVLARNSRRDPEDGTVYKLTTNMRAATPELKTFLSPEIADTFQWVLPGGIMNRIVNRANQIVAPLNASLPPEKQRDGWSLWYIDPPNPSKPPRPE